MLSEFDPQLKEDLVNGIEVAVSEKKQQSNIEKSPENHQDKAQTSQKNPEAQEVIKAPASNTSLNNIKREYVEDIGFDKGNEMPAASETGKKEGKNELVQQTSGGNNKRALEKSNTSKAKLEETDDLKRVETKKSSQKTNELNYHLIVGPEIFVSLKKGSISQQYDIGKTLGEG